MVQSLEMELVPYVPMDQAVLVVDNLPIGEYTQHYQPPFERDGLIESVHELQNTAGVTTKGNIIDLQNIFTDIVRGKNSSPILVSGRCSEPVNAYTKIESLVYEAVQCLEIAQRGINKVFSILRNRNQTGKPRSSEKQILPDGTEVLSHMGDMVNDRAVNNRQPDPSRLVAAAVQSRDLEYGLFNELGHHVPAAHEALVLPFEQSFIRPDEDGKLWALSGDLLWIGDRTRDPNGPHVEMLSQVENPIGIKLGPKINVTDIELLHAKLNPTNKDGKLVFMIRIGLDNPDVLNDVLETIKLHSSNSLILYDIHGSTVTDDKGQKIRAVSRITAEILQLHKACKSLGLQLHGIHLETQIDEDRVECVDELGEEPKDVPDVDPLLNPRQTTNILRNVVELFDDKVAA